MNPSSMSLFTSLKTSAKHSSLFTLTSFTTIYHCDCLSSFTVIIKMQMWMSINFVNETDQFLISINMANWNEMNSFIINQPFDDKMSSTCCRILKLRRMKFVIWLIQALSPLILIFSLFSIFYGALLDLQCKYQGGNGSALIKLLNNLCFSVVNKT